MEVKKEQNKQGRPILKQCTVCTGFDTEGEWRKSEIAWKLRMKTYATYGKNI